MNLGTTIYPHAEAPDDPSRHQRLVGGGGGASVIWEPVDAVHLLCEVLLQDTQEITARGTTHHTHGIVNPGVRAGWNGPGGVQ